MKDIIKKATIVAWTQAIMLPLFAQEITVTGTVTEANGEPLIGAVVQQRDKRVQTVTDMDGHYTINVERGSLLSFTYIGYLPYAAKAASRVDVTMVEDNQSLNELVVVGYGVQKKSDLTGAISSVSKKDIDNRSISRAEEALQGKASGVQLISSSAQPGSSPQIRIRGFSSNGSSSPLYVVDGLICNDLSSVDANNIENIEVLKDGASASIYGAQAGNGVLLVTTKKGSEGHSGIKYDFQYSLTSLSRKPALLNTDDKYLMTTELDPAYSKEDLQVMIDDGLWDGTSSTDWYGELFETSPMTHNTLTFDGANNKGSYLLSLGQLHENGIITGNYDVYNRMNVMLNAQYRIRPWLSVSANANYFKWKSKGVDDTSNGSVIKKAISMSPYYRSAYPEDKLPVTMQNLLASGFTLIQDDDGNYYVPGNPMIDIRNHNSKTSGTTLEGILSADITPFKDVVFTTRLGYRDFNYNYYNHRLFYYNDPASYNTQYNGAERNNTNSLFYQWENFANYTKSIGKIHDIHAMAGMSYSQTKSNYVSASVDKVAEENRLFADVAYPAGDAVISGSGRGNVSRNISYFGRMGYTLLNRYGMQASLRADAADLSILPKENRWGYFPSVSAGWTISEEPFFKKLGSMPVNFLKFRASWGQNGSIRNLGGYAYSNALASYTVGYSFTTATTQYLPAVYPIQMYNPELRWETSKQTDLGIDLRAWGNRLTLSIDWYYKKTKDLIVNGIILPYEAGNNSAPMNAGSIRNTGLELELSWRGNIGEFSYSASANFATLSNKVTYLDKSISDGRIYGTTQLLGASVGYSAFEVGKPIWYFRGFEVDHIDSETGQPYYKTSDGGYTDAPSEDDKRMLGKPMPDFTYGLTLTAAYKGFDFTIFGQGSQGNSAWMAYSIYTWKNIFDKRWRLSTPNADYAQTNTSITYMLSDHYVFDASYFRIKQMQLGYTLPKSVIRKIGIESLRVYLSLDNFFCITSYPGLDPEVSVNSTSGMGIDFGKYPTTKKMLMGFSLNF